jgi:hypothetical protein
MHYTPAGQFRNDFCLWCIVVLVRDNTKRRISIFRSRPRNDIGIVIIIIIIIIYVRLNAAESFRIFSRQRLCVLSIVNCTPGKHGTNTQVIIVDSTIMFDVGTSSTTILNCIGQSYEKVIIVQQLFCI